jgi:hypothetical protein
MIRDFFATFGAAIRLRLSEIEHGITLIEAVSADEFEQNLRAVTYDEEQRADIRQGALEIAKAGFTADEAVAAMQDFRRFGYRIDYELEGIKRYIDGRKQALS